MISHCNDAETDKIDKAEALKKGIILAGDEGFYQYSITFILFLIGICSNICLGGLFLMETAPIVSVFEPATNTTTVTTINYSICKRNYTVLMEQSKHSWVLDYDIYCDKLSVSLLGFFYCLGCVLGSYIVTYSLNHFGPRKSLILAISIYGIVCILLSLNPTNNLRGLYLSIILLGICAIPINILKVNILTEISSNRLRPFLNNMALCSGNLTLITAYFLFEINIHW